jgi:hypothetical protein
MKLPFSRDLIKKSYVYDKHRSKQKGVKGTFHITIQCWNTVPDQLEHMEDT